MTVRPTIQSSPMTPFAGKRAILYLAKLRRLVNGWVAAAIFRHARRAALPALRQLDERALKDTGLYRSQINDVIERVAQSQRRRLSRS
jgi:uncharacterized protein YjiS (DUF1127 family)